MPARGQPEIRLVTGKGGVGKSLLAAALAWRAASEGRKVLLVELGRERFYERLLGLPAGAREHEYRPGLYLDRWDEEACLKEYVSHYILVPRAAELFLSNTVIKALVRAAPTLKELALIGKATGPYRFRWARLDYDLLVIDAFSTGHFLALLRAPRGMHEAIPLGPVGRQTGKILDVLKNPELCRYVVVTLAEELPVTETIELSARIREETGQTARVICNKLLPDVDGEPCESLLENPPANAGPFLAYLHDTRESQRRYLAELRAACAQVDEIDYQYTTDPHALIERLAAQLEP